MTYLLLAALLTALHQLAALIWVGGMFFAYVVLRPTAQELEPMARLALWQGAFRRFFAWVWPAAILLPLTGTLNIYLIYDGFFGAPLAIYLMTGLGLLMVAIFVYVYTSPYKAFARAVDAADRQSAAGLLARLRRLFALNLTLGLFTAAIGAGARYLA